MLLGVTGYGVNCCSIRHHSLNRKKVLNTDFTPDITENDNLGAAICNSVDGANAVPHLLLLNNTLATDTFII